MLCLRATICVSYKMGTLNAYLLNGSDLFLFHFKQKTQTVCVDEGGPKTVILPCALRYMYM